tara:strand:+ start:2231 stop:2347 length:117 start_codon:yes stop_codon:yes gene_type:complete
MSKEKPTIKDVEKHCNENGYYVGEYWFPYRNLNQNKDE